MKANIEYNLIQDNENALSVKYKGIFNIINDDKFKLSYTDNNILNNLMIDKEKNIVSIKNVNELFFKKNEEIDVNYKTAYGIINMTLKCNDVNIEYNKDKREVILFLNYDLLQMGDILHNELNIKISY